MQDHWISNTIEGFFFLLYNEMKDKKNRRKGKKRYLMFMIKQEEEQQSHLGGKKIDPWQSYGGSKGITPSNSVL